MVSALSLKLYARTYFGMNVYFLFFEESIIQLLDIQSNAVESLSNQILVANSLLHFVKETTSMDSLSEFKVPLRDRSLTVQPSSLIEAVDFPIPLARDNLSSTTILERLNAKQQNVNAGANS